MLLLLLAAAAPPTPAGRSQDHVEPLDLTDDLFHRLRAGLFLPEREPLVLRVTAQRPDGGMALAPDEFLEFSWEQGTFEIASGPTGAIVLHLDQEAVLSHLRVMTPLHLQSMSREFQEYPRHPIR